MHPIERHDGVWVHLCDTQCKAYYDTMRVVSDPSLQDVDEGSFFDKIKNDILDPAIKWETNAGFFEGNRPALTESVTQAFVTAPLFVYYEIKDLL